MCAAYSASKYFMVDSTGFGAVCPSPHSDADWEDLAYFGDEMDEDLTDAAAPPRSAYVGHDEAERAKRKVWDKYFGGGRGR